MTRVDFYVLEPPSAAGHDRMMCRIVEKAWQQGHGVYVQCEDDAQARAFDDLLWQFQDTSFVPHALADQAIPESGLAARRSTSCSPTCWSTSRAPCRNSPAAIHG
jgi:DNA polymerase IIIc chi subunit